MKKAKNTNLPLSLLVLHPGLQGRSDDDLPPGKTEVVNGLRFEKSHLEELTDHIEKGGRVPRVRVVRVRSEERGPDNTVPDPVNYVVNGFYRATAFGRAGRKSIPVELVEGTWLDARLEAAAANKDQTAKRRTNADKKRAVLICLNDLKAARVKWTDGKIAHHCGVSDEMVRQTRRALAAEARAANQPEEEEDDAPAEAADGRKFKKPAAKKPKKAKPGQPGDWRAVPVTEYFTNASRPVLAAFTRANVGTMGELADKLKAGDDLGLAPAVVKDIVGEIRELAQANTPTSEEAAEAAEPSVPWEGIEANFAQLVRYVDRIAREHKVTDDDDHKAAKNLLDMLYAHLFIDWKKKLTGAIR